jgi:hypothetical protein
LFAAGGNAHANREIKYSEELRNPVLWITEFEKRRRKAEKSDQQQQQVVSEEQATTNRRRN